MPDSNYRGLLLIGDPHLEGRQPGFRKDDYPNAVLDKLAWCLDYAAENQLLPAILGDLFDKPRDNPNWVLGRLFDMLVGEVLCLYGNHDCADPQLNDHDSLSLLIKAGRLKLLSPERLWVGGMAGRLVVVGGSSYRQPIPKTYSCEGLAAGESRPLVVWLTHHDILIPGYDEGRIRPFAIDGVDLLVNGHIHRRLDEIIAGTTRWLTPGNISRRSRSDANKGHIPAVLHIDVEPHGYALQYIEVPHRPFDEVFHEAVIEPEVDRTQSAFVRGLAELQARRTASGAGLVKFLQHNLQQFPAEVANEIMSLANEVTDDGNE
jgi:hypothetical protein